MMVEKDDHMGMGLGLSLSLSNHQNHHSFQMNSSSSSLFPSSDSSHAFLSLQNPSWIPPSDRNTETKSFLRGIDVNRLPTTTIDIEEEAGVSSPNSTISSVSGKRSERERNGGSDEDNDLERIHSDDEDGDTSRKKLRLSKDQSAILEETFKEHNTLNPKQKMALAKQLGLRPRQVEVWFQNRRARTKLKQTEVDCEFLKRCCENLTEENRRLQKEVQELRALKLSPQFYMQMTPPTTLTMCPSCERVAVPQSGAPSSSTVNPRSHQQVVGPIQTRSIPVNLWGPGTQIQHLRPRP